MGRSLATAGPVIDALRQTEWDLFRGLTRLDDDRRGAATAILERVRQDLCHDEQAVAQGVAITLRTQSREAAKLLASVPPPAGRRPADGQAARAVVKETGITKVGSGRGPGLGRRAILRQELEASLSIATARSRPGRLRISLSWTLFKEERS